MRPQTPILRTYNILLRKSPEILRIEIVKKILGDVCDIRSFSAYIIKRFIGSRFSSTAIAAKGEILNI